MTEVRRAYDLWRIVARETNAVVLLIAHHRKLAGDVGEQVAGSHQAGASVDGIIELRKGGQGVQSNERRVTFTGRDWPDLPEEVIALDSETLVFELRSKYKERQKKAKAEDAVKDITPFCKALVSGPLMQTALRDKVLKWPGGKFNATLDAALDQGAVKRYKDKNPYTGRKVYFLALPNDAPRIPQPQN